MTQQNETLESFENLNLAENEKQLIIRALQKSVNKNDAAEMLGITRHSLRRRMVKHGIGVVNELKPEELEK